MRDIDAYVEAVKPVPKPPIWDAWLDQQSLGFLKDEQASPDSTSILNKQIELGRIIEELLSQTFAPNRRAHRRSGSWMENSVNKLNAKFLSWQDSLPGEMRWDRWGSSCDAVHSSVASLQMLYHTARISLNRPFIAHQCNPAGDPLADSSVFSADSIRICDASADMIVSILNRFRVRHTLAKAPFVFVHGAIIAADVTLVLARYQNNGVLDTKNTNLPSLDTALAELSYAWALAGEARVGLRNILGGVDSERQNPLSVPCLGLSKTLVSTAAGSRVQTMSPWEGFKFQEGGFAACLGSTFELGGDVDADQCSWNQLGLVDSGPPTQIFHGPQAIGLVGSEAG